jgi:uncharacterized Zn-binding protein involved in type VI secretion
MKKIALIVVLLIAIVLPAAGCDYASGGDVMDQLQSWVDNYENNGLDGADEDTADAGPAVISLTYPAGRSPTVFTTGWLFGASCTVDGKDYSDQVKWSGSGSFSPDMGTRSRPSFDAEGANTITLSIKIDDKDYSHTYSVNAKSPRGYACVGMLARCLADGHGAPMDPTNVVGPITTGSSHVLVNGKPAARVGDVGIHYACSGANTFEIVSGDPAILIDGRVAAWIGSSTKHCGGMGTIIGGGGD